MKQSQVSSSPESHFKMTSQSKRIAATFLDAHERRVWLRQMKKAEMAAEEYRRKPLKGRDKSDSKE